MVEAHIGMFPFKATDVREAVTLHSYSQFVLIWTSLKWYTVWRDAEINWMVYFKCLCCCCIEHAVRIWPALWRTYVIWGWDSRSSSKYLCSEGCSPSLKLGGSRLFDASLFIDTKLCVGDTDLFSVTPLRNRKSNLRAIVCCSELRHGPSFHRATSSALP